MITRAATKENALMSLVNSIGNSIDEKSAKANIYNLHYQGLLSDKAGRIMMSVVALTDTKSKSRLQAFAIFFLICSI